MYSGWIVASCLVYTSHTCMYMYLHMHTYCMDMIVVGSNDITTSTNYHASPSRLETLTVI